MYFLGPDLLTQITRDNPLITGDALYIEMAKNVWGDIVRKIAIGGMLFSAGYTLYRMRKSLATGLGRAIRDVKKAATADEETLQKSDTG